MSAHSSSNSILDYVRQLPPYQPGTPVAAVVRELGLDAASVIKLASNENPRGMSPAAREAAIRATAEGERYPDAACYELTHAVAAHAGVRPEEVIVGAGSGELIVLAARAFLDSSRAALVPQYAFAAYGNAIRSVGARQIIVPARDHAHDLDAMAEVMASDVKLIFVATVNNPTGLALSLPELERFCERIPPDVPVVIDDAYGEYLPADRRPEPRIWLRRFPNTLFLRTFSKVYGLASLRVGYGIGDPRVIEALKRLQTPFVVNALAQSAALGALGDTTFVSDSVALNERERDRMAERLGAAGFRYLPSQGNFLLVRVADGPGAYRALLSQGVIIRPLVNYGLTEWVRVTVGLPHENDRFLERLTAVVAPT